MSENVTDPNAPEVVKARDDRENQVTMHITRPGDGQTLQIYIRAPVLAEIISKMTPGNYDREAYSKIYEPILLAHPEAKNRVITRGGIARATKNFAAGTDFTWTDPPRPILLCNPQALRDGYTLTYKVDSPIPPDQIRKWGKMFMDGCQDIISNARAFRMSWVMSKVDGPTP